MEAIVDFFSDLFATPGRAQRLLHGAATARHNQSADAGELANQYARAKGVSRTEADSQITEYMDDCLA